MIKKTIYTLVIMTAGLLLAVSCVKDLSDYAFQEKEEVEIDNSYVDEALEAELVPGFRMDTIPVIVADTVAQRVFRYYFPLSLNPNEPISLIFYFHGSMTGIDPMKYFSQDHVLCGLADTVNAIIVYPKGLIAQHTEETYNWTTEDSDLAFFDNMVKYFSGKDPELDENRIYSSGHSSGAIFSYKLAHERSLVVAAVTPVSGQYRLLPDDEMPERVVPVRAFNGTEDRTVSYEAALYNFNEWSNRIGGYWSESAILETVDMFDYSAEVLAYRDETADLELYSIGGEGHGVRWDKIVFELWNFMSSHTLDQELPLFLKLGSSEMAVPYGKSGEMIYGYSKDAQVEVVSYPEDWTVTIDPYFINVTAPAKGSASPMQGDILLSVTNGSETLEKSFHAFAAETFSVGDIVDDTNGDPMGVVFWVNPYNATEARIVALDEWPSLRWGEFSKGMIGANSSDDGSYNTDVIIASYPNLTESTCAAKACRAYKDGSWYLPAIDDLLELFSSSVYQTVNMKLWTLGADLSGDDAIYWSSTMTQPGYADGWDVQWSKAFRFDVDKVNDRIKTRPVRNVVKAAN